jgi:hypothetical protein
MARIQDSNFSVLGCSSERPSQLELGLDRMVVVG